jgi:hypothetical protein
MGGILHMEPWVVGQSGTDNPALLLVTKPPAISRRKARQATKTVNQWCAGLYDRELLLGVGVNI